MTIHAALYRPIPVKEITPKGWLNEQLKIQLKGLSGNLDLFWPDIANSAWIGGDAEGWERFPYWLDGVIPLAWLLDDSETKQRINKYMDYIIAHQEEDGWLGPRPEKVVEAKDIWSQFLALKVMVVYEDASDDPRMVSVIEKGLRKIDQHINFNPISNWAQFRWYECLIPIYWLYERTSQKWLLTLAAKLKAQGFDWLNFFDEHWPYFRATRQGEWNYMSHVVNNTMALKCGALWWRLSGKDEHLNHWQHMQATLDQYHGMPHGSITGDECIAGKSPVQGTEVCAVVEQMYSMEILATLIKDARIGDRMERLAFNALPATMSEDMWAHQYDQQLNQIECSIRENHHWTTNRADANIYGLEPDFGCCTANFSQGFPKFTASLWQRQGEDTFIATAYAPNTIKTKVRTVPVVIDLKTGYPFRETLNYSVSVEKAVRFNIELRVPNWCRTAELHIDDEIIRAKPGEYISLNRHWSGTTNFKLLLPMVVEIEDTLHYSVHVSRGPLLFSYKIPASWQQINQHIPGREAPHCDWEVHPIAPWNYAIVDQRTPVAKECEFSEQGVFRHDNAGVRIMMDAVIASNWHYDNGNASPIPPTVISDAQIQSIELIPYGASDIRIAEFPVYKANQQHSPS